jgi:hypothetical protein
MFCECGRAGERVLVEVSRKFTVGDFNHLANESRLLLTWLGVIKHGVCKCSYLSKKHTFDAGMQLTPFSGTSLIRA